MDNIIDTGITQEGIIDYFTNFMLVFQGEMQFDLISQYNFSELEKKMKINGANSDRICMTNDCYKKLTKDIGVHLTDYDIKHNKILDDFVFCVKDRDGHLSKYRDLHLIDNIENIWFIRSSVKEYFIRIKDGTIYKVTPIVDMIVNKNICTFGILESESGDSFRFITNPLEINNGICDERLGIFLENDIHNEITQWQIWAWDYIDLLMIFMNKPELMTLRTKSVAVEYEEGKKVKHRKNNKRNKVKIVKYIDINSEDVDRLLEHSKREITCPAWGVVGHYRTYKSGKKIWIAPYKKGKYRDNPDMYKPKDYESQG